ncbi:3,4-dihydroxy-2-butanone-4-phosphate synthase [Bordetella sp. FB-8]|uniref:3,4-dihydroxy-2-butanone-4-phosphate synthase n=1 Tax=Bordetella sp. FB-8 TaxID=1159870 RepID=UPI0003746B1D|nr:3,4-dihydroxy-2-butanone-4-phosphate synthase [Bordetella sp. FB-8]
MCRRDHGAGSCPRQCRCVRLSAALERFSQPLIRENEADLIVAADTLTTPVMAQLIRDGSGIVCLCLPGQTLDRLGLTPMVADNGSRHGTAFTVSVEARQGVTTGVSAADRVTTIKAAVAPDAARADLVSPGHVFPLRAQPGGVLARRGHTEGSVDLARLAGLSPAGVLCELMNPDGTMMRGEELARYAAANGLAALHIAELAQHMRGLQDEQAASAGDLARAA